MAIKQEHALNISDASEKEAYEAFKRTYPAYAGTLLLDDMRASEYGRLDTQGQVYLDYTGSSLYAQSQVDKHSKLLLDGVFGNPHSINPTSSAATGLIDETRKHILKFFNASPDDYIVVFTTNATGALKLVGEAYPFEPGDNYLLAFDNHNSVNGIREFAHAKGATVTYVPVIPPDMGIDESRLEQALEQPRPSGHNLLAYPAQSNFSGVQHSLEWIEKAHSKGWDVLLDCAAFVPTNRLDINRWQPDFVPVSFYKMFGYPTGVGCLIARKSAMSKMRRPWFAGGTITIASVQAGKHYLAEGSEAFEDGTLNFLNIPAVNIGLEHLESIGLDTIHRRVAALTGWLLTQMESLRHSNGKRLARIYGPLDTQDRGGTISFNFFDPDSKAVNHRRIELLATRDSISLRTGCFCNPGSGELAYGLTKDDMEMVFRSSHRMTFDEFSCVIETVSKKNPGAVRVSLGIASNFSDVYRFVQFARHFVDKKASEV